MRCSAHLLTVLLLSALAATASGQVTLTVVEGSGQLTYTMNVDSAPGVWASPSIHVYLEDPTGQPNSPVDRILGAFSWLKKPAPVSAGTYPPPPPSSPPVGLTPDMTDLYERCRTTPLAVVKYLHPLTTSHTSGRRWHAAADIWSNHPDLPDQSAMDFWIKRLEYQEASVRQDDLFSIEHSMAVAMMLQAPDYGAFKTAYGQIENWTSSGYLYISVQGLGLADTQMLAQPPADDDEADDHGLPKVPDTLPTILVSTETVMDLIVRPPLPLPGGGSDPDYFGLDLSVKAVVDDELHVPMSGIFLPLDAEVEIDGSVVTLSGDILSPGIATFDLPAGLEVGEVIKLVSLENPHSKTVLPAPITIVVEEQSNLPSGPN